MMTQFIKYCRLFLYLSLFFISLTAFAGSGTTVDSANISIRTTKSNTSFIIGSGNNIFVNTFYYGYWNQYVGTTKGKCPTGFNPKLVASVFGTPDSDSIGGGCQLYGINNSVYYTASTYVYNIYANVHLRYPSDCADKGLFLSYVFICEPN
jgi:hypothetical protein